VPFPARHQSKIIKRESSCGPPIRWNPFQTNFHRKRYAQPQSGSSENLSQYDLSASLTVRCIRTTLIADIRIRIPLFDPLGSPQYKSGPATGRLKCVQKTFEKISFAVSVNVSLKVPCQCDLGPLGT